MLGDAEGRKRSFTYPIAVVAGDENLTEGRKPPLLSQAFRGTAKQEASGGFNLSQDVGNAHLGDPRLAEVTGGYNFPHLLQKPTPTTGGQTSPRPVTD